MDMFTPKKIGLHGDAGLVWDLALTDGCSTEKNPKIFLLFAYFFLEVSLLNKNARELVSLGQINSLASEVSLRAKDYLSGVY